jgi:hypothetical protein
MKKIIIIAAMLVSVISSKTFSQMGGQFLQDNVFSFSWQMAFPTGDLKSWLPENSYRGWDIEYTKLLNDHVAVGGHIGWQGYYKKYPRSTYEFPSGSLTTTIFKTYYTIPMHGIVTYYFIPDKFIQPFASFLIGVNYNERDLQFGQYIVEDQSWNFSIAPELGLIIPFGELSQWGLNARARYLYNVYQRDGYKGYGEVSGLAYLNVMIGLSYSF